MKEGVVNAHGLLLSDGDKELPVQQHEFVVNFELDRQQAGACMQERHYNKQAQRTKSSSRGIL